MLRIRTSDRVHANFSRRSEVKSRKHKLPWCTHIRYSLYLIPRAVHGLLFSATGVSREQLSGGGHVAEIVPKRYQKRVHSNGGPFKIEVHNRSCSTPILRRGLDPVRDDPPLNMIPHVVISPNLLGYRTIPMRSVIPWNAPDI
jgi:hypothetical protein